MTRGMEASLGVEWSLCTMVSLQWMGKGHVVGVGWKYVQGDGDPMLGHASNASTCVLGMVGDAREQASTLGGLGEGWGWLCKGGYMPC